MTLTCLREASEAEGRRRYRRYALSALGQARDDQMLRGRLDGTPVEIVDIGLGGARVRTVLQHAYAIRDFVLLEVQLAAHAVEVMAEVRYRDGLSLGLEFVPDVSPSFMRLAGLVRALHLGVTLGIRESASTFGRSVTFEGDGASLLVSAGSSQEIGKIALRWTPLGFRSSVVLRWEPVRGLRLDLPAGVTEGGRRDLVAQARLILGAVGHGRILSLARWMSDRLAESCRE